MEKVTVPYNSTWFNVNHTLPEFAKKVLIAIKFHDGSIIVRQAERQPVSARDWVWWLSSSEYNVDDVQWWSPLPEPPSEEPEDDVDDGGPSDACYAEGIRRVR